MNPNDPHVLGGFTYPYNPPTENIPTIKKKKSRSDYKTLNNNITFNWGFVLQDNKIKEYWPLMDKDFFEQLLSFYNANQDLQYNPKTGKVYVVEILSFSGEYYNEDYYQDVELIMKIKDVV